MVMDRFDFSPLFRSTIGFDRLTRLVDAASRVDVGVAGAIGVAFDRVKRYA
jgi:hypothetical protein